MTRTSNTTSNNIKLLIFDSHPVQYRTPIWQAIHSITPNSIHVVYATICSSKSYEDKEFGQKIKWDEPLLEGYPYTVLNSENGTPLYGWNSLTGKGIRTIIQKLNPQMILLTGLNYRFNHTALWIAKRMNIAVHLRCETQDEAFPKSKLKKWLRTRYYKTLYRLIDRFYYIGELNKQHYLNHSIGQNKLIPVPYFTVNRFMGLTEAQKRTQKQLSRNGYGFKKDSYVIGFSGKLIPKKNPEILFRMIDELPETLRNKIVLYFIGSGELQTNLLILANIYHERYKTRTIFTGFVNQSQIAQHYLTLDMLILPSRQMGETWGLVVNEAMQAGCSIITSNFVGCSADFKALERFEIFQDNDEKELAQKVQYLMQFERDFNWAQKHLNKYSLENCTNQIIDSIKEVSSI